MCALCRNAAFVMAQNGAGPSRTPFRGQSELPRKGIGSRIRSSELKTPQDGPSVAPIQSRI